MQKLLHNAKLLTLCDSRCAPISLCFHPRGVGGQLALVTALQSRSLSSLIGLSSLTFLNVDWFVFAVDSKKDKGQPKSKSHKKKKRTIKEVQADLKSEKAMNAPAKVPKEERDKVAKCAVKNVQIHKNLQTHNKKQQKGGVFMDQKTTLPCVLQDLTTPTKSAQDAGRMVKNNFSQGTHETKAKVAASSKRKKDDAKPIKEQTGKRKVARCAESPAKPQLGINMRKLTVEDFILLEPGADDHILVSPDHLSCKESFKKLARKSNMQWDSFDPRTQTCCCDAAVVTNSQLDGLSHGVWT
jgi:hypothetical protein